MNILNDIFQKLYIVLEPHNVLIQILTVFFGVAAIWFVGRKEHWSRWGYIIGLISQIFWVGAFISCNQKYMLLAPVFYTYVWAVGLKKNWRHGEI